MSDYLTALPKFSDPAMQQTPYDANMTTPFVTTPQKVNSLYGYGTGFGAEITPGQNTFGGLQKLQSSTFRDPASFGAPVSPSTIQGGSPATLGGDWSGVDRWNDLFQSSASKYGVPVNMLKAIAKLESGGDPNAQHGEGVYGIMAINSNEDVWGQGPWMYDNAANIDKGAEVLKSYYDQYKDWGEALRHYHGIGWDGNTTDKEYRDIVMGNWDQLNSAVGTAGMGFGSGQSWALNSIWGGSDAPLTQDFGMTDFARAHPEWYHYGADYGVEGHTGLDVGMEVGTALYSPVSGTVVCAGTGNGAAGNDCTDFTSPETGNGWTSGRLEIELDNGQRLILGHVQSSLVQPGQRVNAGAMVARSGSNNGGHVHIEWRVPDPSTGSGFRIIDPRQALGGSFSGTFGSAPSGGTGYSGQTGLAGLAHAWGYS